MGIDTEFRRLLETKYDTCFGDGPIPQNKGLLVVDLLTTAFSAIGPRFNYTFTGDEFVRFVFDHASAGFDGGQIKMCVITADLQVSRNKARDCSTLTITRVLGMGSQGEGNRAKETESKQCPSTVPRHMQIRSHRSVATRTARGRTAF